LGTAFNSPSGQNLLNVSVHARIREIRVPRLVGVCTGRHIANTWLRAAS
jgi:hypothetical protein